MHDACLAISRGDLDVVLVTGAEAMYARALARRDPVRAPLEWASQPARRRRRPSPSAWTRPGATELEMNRGVLLPVHAYPLFENALRAANGWTLGEHAARIGALWSRFSEVAAANPDAWIRTPRTADEIVTPGRTTGWSRSPIPSCARPTCRSTRAPATSSARPRRPAPPACPRSAGSSRWPARTPTTTGSSPSGAELHRSPAIRLAGAPPSSWPGSGSTTSLRSTSTRASRWWCRWPPPSSGSPSTTRTRPLTLTGGLTFGGGPGNNYTSHGIARAVGALRAGPGTAALVTGLGWYATKHSIGVYASRPPAHAASRALRLARRPARGRRPAPVPGRRRGDRRRCTSRPTR